MVRWRVLLLPFAALAGAAVAALPTVAAGTSPPSAASFAAIDYAWQISGSTETQATIAQDGTVTFDYPSGASTHNADFGTGPHPSSCTQTAGASSGAVPPLPHQPTAPGWSGTCTFNTPGTYTFHCDLHPFMSGTIVVQASGTTTTSTTSTTTATTTTTGTTTGITPTGTTSTVPQPTTTPATTPTPGSGAARGGSPLAGTAARAIMIARRQRGSAVRGSVSVSAAGAGGRLEVQAFAARAALTEARQRASVRVGRLVRRSLPAGIVRFSIPLNSAAKRALAHRGRLKLVVRIAVASRVRVQVSVLRSVTLLRARLRLAQLAPKGQADAAPGADSSFGSGDTESSNQH